jgi:alpha-glucosidase
MTREDERWWREGVLYQIYVRSFRDSNGDGIGDLAGVTERLDHLAWLGVDGIWLSPVNSSPNLDWGYDVTDYRGVDPELGDLETLDRLVAEAGRRGIRILLDLVPNHTSDRHPWFVEARRSRSSGMRDRYVWADPAPDGGPPNNWRSVFGGPAWELDDATGQYYLHNFLAEQPDLNWWSEDVRREFEAILAFWFDRGIAGFRIDVANGLVKDADLRDDPPVAPDDPEPVRRLGQRQVHKMNRPEVHEVYRSWRRLGDEAAPPRILIGETWTFDAAAWASYYGSGSDELHLCFNFPFAFAAFGVDELRSIVERAEAILPDGAQPVWTASNHDLGRFPTRWCGDRDAATRCALLILLTLRGTPFLYYGDELGMAEVDVPPDRGRDTVGVRLSPDAGRDRCRTPMPWDTDAPNAGFADAGEPWLPLGEVRGRDVEAQRGDPASTLTFTRDVIAARRGNDDLRSGAYRRLASPDGAWVWRRGERTTIAVNLSDELVRVDVGGAEIVVSTERTRDGESVDGVLELGPWSGALLRAR